MRHKSKIILLAFIAAAIPLTVILSLQVQNYRKNAAEPIRKMALGISIPFGAASKDINTDAQIAEIEKFASPVANGGVGAYPASYSIWTDFSESGWQYSSRSKFPNSKLLNYLDSKKITPMIFMAPVGTEMRKAYGTLEQAKKYSNQSIADGAWDAYFIEWANAAKAYGKPMILRYAWEMNGTWFPWSPYNANGNGKDYYDVGNTPENYVAAWRHIYNVIKPIAPNVKFFWCPIAVNGVNSYLERFYPGNNYVDYVGFDEYNSYPNRTENLTLSSTWTGSMEAIRDIVTGSSTTLSTKPIIVGETGLLANNELRYDKLNYNTIYTTYPDIFGIIYFDIDMDYFFGVQSEPGRNWRLSGKSDNPNSTFQGVDLRPKYNTFVVQEKFQGKFNPAYEITQSPTPTITPSLTPIPTKTPTPIPSITQSDPIGYHDSATCTVARGWTCDPSNFSTALEVNFYADGTSTTGTFLGKITANLTRESAVGDMCGGNLNHGFSFNIPTSLIDGKTHSIYAYATNIGTGSNKLLTNSPKTVTCQTPTPTKSPTPTPTPIISQTSLETKLNFPIVKLHGIGTGGDNTNPSSIGNTNPITKTRNLTVEIYNSSDLLISTSQGNINYSQENGYFKGEVILNPSLASGSYIIKVKSDKYLRKQIIGITSIIKNTTITLPSLTLITGDSNNDNLIDIKDFNIIIDCYSDLLTARNCSDADKKASADLSDDGNVNAADYNLFLRELSAVAGD